MQRLDVWRGVSPGRGHGLFGPAFPDYTVLGQYTGNVVRRDVYHRLCEAAQSNGSLA